MLFPAIPKALWLPIYPRCYFNSTLKTLDLLNWKYLRLKRSWLGWGVLFVGPAFSP
jgi:hypothetical protein